MISDTFYSLIDTFITRDGKLGAIAAYGSYTESVWPVYIRDLNCTGSEGSIYECPHNGITGYICNQYNDASIKCQG